MGNNSCDVPIRKLICTGFLFALSLAHGWAQVGQPEPGLSGQGQELAIAALESPYEDIHQQAIRFGLRSFYLAPWRSYMDTRSADQFLDCLGINFNVDPDDAAATAKLLKEAGFRSARVEFGWGNLSYDDPNKTLNEETRSKIFRALKQEGIRPLVVLNSNSTAPAPYKYLRAHLLEAAPAGSREIHLDKTNGIRPGYTGLMRVLNERMAYPLITAADESTGKCELSAPLPHALPAGEIVLADLKYHPFSRPFLENGAPNPWSQETIEGWKIYVTAVCAKMKHFLGTDGNTDAGFDLEVWNELSFGSDFLREDAYYQPKRKLNGELTYQNHGRVAKGLECLLAITVDYVNDSAHHLPEVRVISGFANQQPWDNGTTMWPGQTGFSRHFYTALDPDDPFHDLWGHLSPTSDNRPDSGPVNALDRRDGAPDHRDWYTVVPGSFFVPTVSISMPEALHYGYVPEYITRDIQPFPGMWSQHFRFSHPGDGHPAEFWMTETNTGRFPWLVELRRRNQISADDPRLITLSHHIGAKALLRTFVFDSHKGVHTIEIFAAREKDLQLAVIPEAFFTALRAQNHQLTDTVRSLAGEQIAVISRVVKLMQSGEPLAVTRPLSVDRMVEHQPRLVFQGDGTPEHPDRFNRDDFACLPFQLGAGKYAIAYYVVTQNLVHDWNPQLNQLDPARYDMPEQTFDLWLDNVRGDSVKLSAWDPMTDRQVPVKVLSSRENQLAVQIQSVDYPRFLIMEESFPGPLILNPSLQALANGSARVSFQTNLPVEAKLTWGPWPQRNADGNVDLPEGTDFNYIIPKLPQHEGVKVEVGRTGLTTSWPRWNFDVAGVIRRQITDLQPTHDSIPPTLDRLPGLDQEPLPDAYTLLTPQGSKWKEEPATQTLEINSGPAATHVRLTFITPSQDAASQLLPSVSVLDQCVVKRVRVGGAPAWRLELNVDPSANPNYPFRYQLIYLVPMAKGWLQLRFETNDQGMTTDSAAIQQVVGGLRLTWNGVAHR
jgi:hypothetical protein